MTEPKEEVCQEAPPQTPLDPDRLSLFPPLPPIVPEAISVKLKSGAEARLYGSWFDEDEEWVVFEKEGGGTLHILKNNIDYIEMS